jgi:hypothetical protein
MIIEQFLNRNSWLGNKLVLNTFGVREKLTRIREGFNKDEIRYRQELVPSLTRDLPFEIQRKDGYLVLDGFQHFPEVQEIIDQSLKVVSENDVEAIRKNKKEQLLIGLLKKETLTLDSPYMRFVLRPEVIGAVSKYLGIVPVVNMVDVWYSRSKKTDTLRGSQLHHLDWAAQSQVKIFIYATDVPEESGPLVVMEAGASRKLQKQLKYKFEARVTDDVADKHVGQSPQHTMIGKKGAVIMADTSRCFHYGSRVKDENHYRVVALFQFLPPQAFILPIDYKKSCIYSFLSNPDLPEYQQLVLGAK